MNYAGTLRRELAQRAQAFADAESLSHCLSYGEAPSVCFLPEEAPVRHGNFLPASYKAILANAGWRRRLEKVHTHGKRSLPSAEHGRWMELDACTSSDALLLNVFCYPGILREGKVLALLDSEPGPTSFGYRARVPLANGRFDRTEIDLRLGNLLIEAKLTEGDFQSAEKSLMLSYRDFTEVFEIDDLSQTVNRYSSYQLLRNVLAAYAMDCSFCVMVDARRPDLVDAWYSVVRCVKPLGLRTRLRISTWQEVAQKTPPTLRKFLAKKYGIETTAGTAGKAG